MVNIALQRVVRESDIKDKVGSTTSKAITSTDKVQSHKIVGMLSSFLMF